MAQANHLEDLYGKAVNFVKDKNFIPCPSFYRNKNREYFDNIFNSKKGIMSTYKKDNGGDEKNPINNELDGLFFSTKTYYPGQPKPESPFGEIRLLIPSEKFFNDDSNWYFSDFYCLDTVDSTTRPRIHYLQIVITKKGTKADIFCREKLKPVDKFQNDFLFLDRKKQEEEEDSPFVFVNHVTNFYVEVFYTEDIDITEYKDRLQETTMIGRGSTPDGLRKYKYCTICN